MFDINTQTNSFMTIRVTQECNKKCPFCVDEYRGEQGYISLDNIRKAINFAKSEQIADILFMGGEPTLHPEIIEIAKTVKEEGFKTILTTNYSKPDIVKALDEHIDCFNVSFYNQKVLPNPKDFKADLTLNVLLFQGGIDSKKKLDNFIKKYGHKYHLKFATLIACNEWSAQRQHLAFLDTLDAKKVILFNELEGLVYKNALIKRYDKVLNYNAEQSYKCLTDGRILRTWKKDNSKSIILNQLTNIKNTEYITVNENGIFVGEKPATTYRGREIYDTKYVKNRFKLIQEKYPEIHELYITTSETAGIFAQIGNPTSKHGQNVWCRIKTKCGLTNNWVFGTMYGSADYCAEICAFYCVTHIYYNPEFSSAVLAQKTQTPIKPGIILNQLINNHSY